METVKLYKENVYLKETRATVINVQVSGEFLRVVLDKTVFFPTGGGQSCDKGTIGGSDVIDVVEENGIVFHKIKASDAAPVSGQEVQCVIDWDHRFDNMQRHCGEHILSGAFYHLFGGINCGFHMGKDHMTLDISLEKGSSYDELTHDMIIKAESYANRVVWDDLPVTVKYFKDRSQVQDVPLRKALNFDEDISIVYIGDTKSPADCVPCCGTHPSTSGQVGLIKIYKTERYKGMYRIYCDAGLRALKEYQRTLDILSRLSADNSTDFDGLAIKLASDRDKGQKLHDELVSLKRHIIKMESENISDMIVSSPGPYLYKSTCLSGKEIMKMGEKFIPLLDLPLGITAADNTTLVLFSSGAPNCNDIAKKKASAFSGKGGGRDTSATIKFPNRNLMNSFIKDELG